MTDRPKTLLQMAGADLTPASLSASAVVVIDAQRVYSDGPLVLTGVGPAAAEIASLLQRARTAGTPIVHVRHVGPNGSPFGKDGNGFKYMAEAEPASGEVEVEKALPNAFAGTNLEEILKEIGRRKLIIVGFMSHMCVSATARAALDHGYGATVVAAAVATRPLPSATGTGTVAAELLHEVAMTELSDRFAIIAPTSADIPD